MTGFWTTDVCALHATSPYSSTVDPRAVWSTTFFTPGTFSAAAITARRSSSDRIRPHR